LQRAFPLHILMVPSSVITATADGECLTCGEISLGETVRLGSFKFIADYFDDLSLSPRRGDAGTAFMGSTHSGASTPWRAMIEDSIEESLTASSGEGCLALFPPAPSPRRHGMEALPALIATTPWLKDILDIAVA
jgi:hypothetical protein